MSQGVIDSLVNYKGESVLRKYAMNILVSFLTPDQIGTLKDEFQKVDTDFSGFLDLQELEEALVQALKSTG